MHERYFAIALNRFNCWGAGATAAEALAAAPPSVYPAQVIHFKIIRCFSRRKPFAPPDAALRGPGEADAWYDPRAREVVCIDCEMEELDPVKMEK